MSLYSIPENWRLIIICLAIIAVIMRSLCYKQSSFLNDQNSQFPRSSTLQLTLLLWTIIQAFLIVKTQMNVRESLITPLLWPTVRNLLFVLITVLMLIKIYQSKQLKYLIFVPFIALSSPLVEAAYAGHFAIFYMTSLTFLILQSFYNYRYYSRRLKILPSRLTIKSAIDSLNSGVLFAKQNGEIILINQTMQAIMAKLLGKAYWPAEVINTRAIPFDENGTYHHVESNRTTTFKLTNLALNNTHYQQITSTDISEQWRMTETLNAKKAELESAIAALTDSIDNIMTICQKSEYRQLEIAVHNKMSRSISLLLGALRQNTIIDKAQLLSFVGELIDSFTSASQPNLANISLNDVIENFKLLGVTINYNNLPTESSVLHAIYGEIIREATSNAVRHGFASIITINYQRNRQMERMIISNNGELPSTPMHWGIGLKGMAEKLAAVGAKMTLQCDEKFSIIIEVDRQMERSTTDD